MMARVPDTTRVLEWSYQFGPPRRSWRWFAVVFAIGLGLAGLFFLTLRNEWGAGGWMIVWLCMMLATALAPARTYHVRLDRNHLTIEFAARRHTIVDRNLSEYATYKISEIPADRLNPAITRITLRPRDGRAPVEISLTGDPATDGQIARRIADTVPLAPDIAPGLLERFDRIAERIVGWR
ncbi:hypothetical protein [Microbacterium sp. NPDC086615]|uniref:hypothetical protein n=1 Tax=Microbacterium sp. NPDC086615 TaxID=3154865 RepID=UPI0034129300